MRQKYEERSKIQRINTFKKKTPLKRNSYMNDNTKIKKVNIFIVKQYQVLKSVILKSKT